MGKAAGKRQQRIAKDAACSASSVSHAGADPEIAGLMLDCKRANVQTLKRMYGKVLSGCEKDMGNRGANVRAHARAEAVKLIAAGEAVEPQERSSEGQFTLTELLVLVKQRK